MRYLFMFFVCSNLLLACKKNPLEVDISSIDSNVIIERFDKDLFSYSDTSNVEIYLSQLAKKYNPFFDNFTEYIIRLGKYDEPDFPNQLFNFLSDTIITQLYDSCQNKFGNIQPLESELSLAFRYYKYYYPNKKLPRVLTHISGFNESIIMDEGIISIGIDKYLGSKHVFYERLGYYKYLRKKMNPKQIPIDFFLAIGKDEIPEGKLNTLLDHIIYSGKIYYFLKAMFPNKKEYDILTYAKDDELWCKLNQADMWKYLAGNKHLFSTDMKIINRYIQDAPFTKGFPKGSPGKTGIWIGLQIVKSYIKNTDTTLVEMLEQTDYEAVLKKSGYKP